MSLTEFAMLFEPFYPKKVSETEESIDHNAYEEQPDIRRPLIMLSDGSKMVVINIPAVVRVPYFIATSDPENFFYSLLVQYMPYRSEIELLEGFDNAKEAFLARENRLKETSRHIRQHRERDQQLENAFIQVHAFEILEQPEIINPEAEEELPDTEMSNDLFQRAQQAMNIDQRQLFILITEGIKNQLNGGNEREKIFVTGGAGTGKTFLFNLLKNQVNRCYGKSVVKVGVLTGVAARLIGGSTLYRLLKLPVQKDGDIVSMSLLTGNYLRVMRQLWQNVEFRFIDEISMVPYEMLCMIDSRLRQLKSPNACFGGINVLLFGDLMQLPPLFEDIKFSNNQNT
ncbi:ATP-dependent DNA helicase [Caerostris darwini]|uniref:ATP-dependent DNA helicase n=1 Tax=Caerostris darwini TaxID=1538125 RepID=A0AAV4R555_9ARAC|nr:ATP-dependent DNA helicase [Caerostris darwini]